MILTDGTRPLVVLDCDSTIIQQEVIDLLAAAAGTQTQVARITERAMRGSADFSASLAERVATLRGTPTTAFAEVYQQLRLSPGVRELIAAVHDRGGIVGVASGGFHEVLDPLAADLGVDVWRANRLDVQDDRLTGRTTGPIIDAAAKVAALEDWAASFQIPMSATMAIGDGANDIPMLHAAAIGVAYRARPIVRDQADITIEHSHAQAIALLDRLR